MLKGWASHLVPGLGTLIQRLATGWSSNLPRCTLQATLLVLCSYTALATLQTPGKPPSPRLAGSLIQQALGSTHGPETSSASRGMKPGSRVAVMRREQMATRNRNPATATRAQLMRGPTVGATKPKKMPMGAATSSMLAPRLL